MSTISENLTVGVTDIYRGQFLQVFMRTLIYVVLLLITVVEAFPLVWMLLTSVKNQREVFTSFLPETLDFSNFRRVWVAVDLPTHLVNSLRRHRARWKRSSPTHSCPES